jgi:integrase
VEEFLRRGYEKWTPDRNGNHNSALAYLKAFDFFIHHHPLFKVRRIGFINLDHETVRDVLNGIISKRGYASHFDVHILKTIVTLLQIAGASTDGHRKFLRKIQKVATSKPRPHIKVRSEEFKRDLLEHSRHESAKTPRHGLTEARDKAILNLLMNTPFRALTIRSLKRSDLCDSFLSIPASAMKTRRALGFKMPDETLMLIQKYLDRRSDDSDSLFARIDGQPLSHNALYKIVRKHTARCLKQHLGIHDARRVVGTFVAKILGPQISANVLIVSVPVLQRHYDLADSSDRLEAALEKINGVKG